jgi:methylmalonyl-CoA mutase cobalamin-binding domain/chain
MKPLYSRSKIALKSSYSSTDVAPGNDDEAPGEFPFTRGRMRPKSVQGSWIQRELSGEGSPSDSNKQIKYLIGKGQFGIDVIGDSPTQGLMDPDHPLSIHSAGTQGVSLCCKQDFVDLIRDIPLDKISLSSSMPQALSLPGLCLAAKEVGIPWEKLRGSVLQPPLFSEDCAYAIHLPVSMRTRLALDSMEFCAKYLPKFHSYVEDTYFFSESGLNAVEEMALGFVQIRFLTRELIKRGGNVDQFAPRIAILVNCSMDFFEEIAKIRASRRLYAKMMREEFNAKDPRSCSAVFTSHTSGLSLTAQQPVNNIVRGTLQSLSLVLGGVQALEISAFDEAYRTPSPESHLVGLRTQQVIDLETGITKVADPLGGSYYVESLTNDMEKAIWDMVQEIEAKGQPEELVEQGYFRQIFHHAMERQNREVASGEVNVVGVNIHQIPEEEDTMLKEFVEQKIEPCNEHIEKIKTFKKTRDFTKTANSLKALKTAVENPNINLMEPIINALDANATSGEISGVMRLGLGLPYDPYGKLTAII